MVIIEGDTRGLDNDSYCGICVLQPPYVGPRDPENSIFERKCAAHAALA